MIEKIYDTSYIAGFVCQKNPNLAMDAFIEQINHLIPYKDDLSILHIFLNSLNFGIYNSLLHREKFHFCQCCHENQQTIKTCIDWESFLVAGEEIIQSYCVAFSCPEDCSRPCNSRCNLNIDSAREYIDAHLNESLTLEKVANHIFINKSYFSHVFHCRIGMTFSDYLTSRRIEKAKELLLSTEHAIQDIAHLCGFSSSAYFSSVFKRKTNQTPKQFRSTSTTAGMGGYI